MARKASAQTAATAGSSSAIQNARACAFKARPYFARALFSMRLVETDKIETLSCDPYLRVYYNPDFVEAHSRWEIAGVLIHEINHWLRRHHKRAEAIASCDHQVWNLAGDCEINDDLLVNGDVIKLPADGIFPKSFNLDENQTAEQYYAALLKNAKGRKAGSKPGCGDCGSIADGLPRPFDIDPPSTASVEDGPAVPGTADVSGVADIDGDLIRRQIAESIRDAARGRGNVPASLRQWADVELAPPTVPWQKVLRSQITRAAREISAMADFTFTRPSRRSSALPGIVIPGFTQPVPRIALVIDTSGSMGRKEGAAVLSEVQGILRSVGESVRVVTIDAAVSGDRDVRRVHQIVCDGGGGTDMRVGLDHLARDKKDRPDVVVVLTDGDTPWPDTRVRGIHRVIACLVRDGATPPPAWIKTVRVTHGDAS